MGKRNDDEVRSLNRNIHLITIEICVRTQTLIPLRNMRLTRRQMGTHKAHAGVVETESNSHAAFVSCFAFRTRLAYVHGNVGAGR